MSKKRVILLVAGIFVIISGIVAISNNTEGGALTLIVGAGLIVWAIVSKKKGSSKAAPAAVQTPTVPSTDVPSDNPFEWKKYHIVGVSFRNGKQSRQAILRHIKFRDPPYDEEINISIKKYDFEGKPAIGVYANDAQIGNIAKDSVNDLLSIWDRIDAITAINVYGGGWDDGGEALSYGAEIVIKVKKQIIQSIT